MATKHWQEPVTTYQVVPSLLESNVYMSHDSHRLVPLTLGWAAIYRRALDQLNHSSITKLANL